jgi:predicted dehydrogenase
MSSVRVALIGCGGMGKSLINQLKTLENAQLVAGVDPFEQARQAFGEAYGVPTFASIDEVIAAENPDGVIVAVPNDQHAPMTLAAAAAGKHVFCEKPMALSLGDCQAMIDACKSAGVKLQIGQVLRYLPDFDYALRMIAAGDLGDMRHGVIFRYSAPKEHWGHTWRDDPAKVGHYLFEVAIHEIDFARCVFGKPVAVTAWDTSMISDDMLWDKVTTAVVEYESGALCTHVEGMLNAMGRNEVELSGTKGAVRFHWGKDFAYQPLEGEGWSKTGAEVAEGVETGTRREVREWVEAILNDTPCTIPGEEGMANIELALAMLESNRQRRRIELPLAR